MKKSKKVIRTIHPHKWFFILLYVSCLCSLAFAVASFFPIIQIKNTTTQQINPIIPLSYVAFGHSSYDPFISGNLFALILYIASLLGFLFIVIFIIWLSISKTSNSIKFLLLAFAILSGVCGVTLIFIAPLILVGTNSMYHTNFYEVSLNAYGIVAAILECLSLLISFSALFYIAFKTEKRQVYIEEK